MKRRTFIVSGIAIAGLSAHSQVHDLNDAINKAGRQRMLSQRMAKAYLALVHKVEAASAQQVLDKSMALFDRQLIELKSYAPSPEIKDTYLRLETEWSAFKGVLVGSAPSREHVASLLQMDGKILALAQQGTQQYEAASAKPVGKLINIAGRQRMLSQRMAKFCLGNGLLADAHGAQAEMAKARTEFVAALEILRKAPEATQRIKDELALADSQWVFFELGLRASAGQATPKQLADVFVTSENLLAVMDNVTSLYSRLG